MQQKKQFDVDIIFAMTMSRFYVSTNFSCYPVPYSGTEADESKAGLRFRRKTTNR